MEILKNINTYLNLAQQYANNNSGCTKVMVGAVILNQDGHIISSGANRATPNLCRTSRGCLRVEKYGENSKLHRNPEDCRAIHSEVDAISKCDKKTKGCTIVVTRYPCEACARAIVAAGITRVIYGREQEISDLTKEILEGVEVIWQKSWHAPDVVV